MIGVSRLCCQNREPSDAIRFGRFDDARTSQSAFPDGRKPVVVWNCTQRCNLACRHCYSSSSCVPAADELTTSQAKAMIGDLAAFGAPVLLFSGGEPLMRPDVLELIQHCAARGLRAVLSTNGTLITPQVARHLGAAGLGYAGISLDGLAQTNDAFRGRQGAFDAAIAGVRNCMATGVKVGLRMTINRYNVADIGGVFDLLEQLGVARICFYHLAYTGRGGQIRHDALSHQQTRQALDLIVARTFDLHARGKCAEVLTVGNHADGPYLYMKLLATDPPRAQRCLDLLRRNGGDSSGNAIGCVSWNGDVLPDQFWRDHVLGNVTTQPFSRIWSDGWHGLSSLCAKPGEAVPPASVFLADLRDRRKHLHCRCTRCRWLDVCNGNLRSRAQAATGDMWADDPACYLTDEEIGM
jgi:MoaA/NifB/PqqE/SkfB family radical SAM enzyme